MHLTRRHFLRGAAVAGGASVLAGAASFFYGARVETEWLETEKIAVELPSLPSGLEGFRIVQLSDFHLYPHTRLEFIRSAVQRANDLKPDLIVLTGDYVLSNAEAIYDLAPVLAGLNARHGVFSILGNHDYWQGISVVRAGLHASRLPLLCNSGVEIKHQESSFFLAGLDDVWSGNPDLGKALEKAPGNLPVVLLAHEPDVADEVAVLGRISLQLSGHSHGGQVRLPLVGAPYLPHYGRKYDLGLYDVAGMRLYTNRGLGVTAPIRINCRPELTEITLRAAIAS